MAATEQATEAQTGFIRSLIRERDTDKLTLTQRAWLETQDFTRLNRSQASRVIAALKDLPKVPAETAAAANLRSAHENKLWPEVRAGRYAACEEDGVLRFYHVSRPTEGRWAGYIFIEVRASDELFKVKDVRRKTRILDLLALEPKAAMLRYGQELGHCGHCGRTLTNETSREVGIGPICRAKMGW